MASPGSNLKHSTSRVTTMKLPSFESNRCHSLSCWGHDAGRLLVHGGLRFWPGLPGNVEDFERCLCLHALKAAHHATCRHEWRQQQPLRSGSLQGVVRMAFPGHHEAFWVPGPAFEASPSLYLTRGDDGSLEMVNADAPNPRPVQLALRLRPETFFLQCLYGPRRHAAHCGGS